MKIQSVLRYKREYNPDRKKKSKSTTVQANGATRIYEVPLDISSIYLYTPNRDMSDNDDLCDGDSSSEDTKKKRNQSKRMSKRNEKKSEKKAKSRNQSKGKQRHHSTNQPFHRTNANANGRSIQQQGQRTQQQQYNYDEAGGGSGPGAPQVSFVSRPGEAPLAPKVSSYARRF